MPMKLHLPKLLFALIPAVCSSASFADYSFPVRGKPSHEASLVPDNNIEFSPDGFEVKGENGPDSEYGFMEFHPGGGYYETKWIRATDWGGVDMGDNEYLIVGELSASNNGYINFAGCSTIEGNVVIGCNGWMSLYDPFYSPHDPGTPSVLIKGDLTFQDGSGIECDANPYTGYLGNPVVYVDGTLNIAGKVTLDFYYDCDGIDLNNPPDSYAYPPRGYVLFVSKAKSGNVDGISCIVSWEGDEADDYREKSLDMHIEVTPQSNGLYVFTLEDGPSGGGGNTGGDTPTDPAAGRTPITGNETLSVAQLADNSWSAYIRKGGTLDAAGDLAEDAVLTDKKVAGDGGTLVLGGAQTMKITGSQTVGYSVVGKEGLAGHLVFAGDGTWTLSGDEYLVDDLTCSQGKLTISKMSTVGNEASGYTLGHAGDGKTDVLVNNNGTIANEGKVYAATLETATGGVFDNNGSASVATVQIGEDSALFNRGDMTASTMKIDGSLNNSGKLGSDDEIAVGGTVYNSGQIEAPVNLQRGAALDMLEKGTASVVKVNEGAALFGSGGRVDSAFVAQGGRLGSTSSLTGLDIGRADMGDGSVIAGCLGASNTGLHVGELLLNGTVGIVLGTSESIVDNPGLDSSDASFAITDLKADSVSGGGTFDLDDITIEDTQGYLEDGATLVWKDNALTAVGKVNGKALARFSRGDASLLADTLWSSASALRSFAGVCAGSNRLGQNGTFWVSGLGNFSHMSAEAGVSGYDFKSSGYAVGATANLAEKTAVGIALGQSFGKHESGNKMLRDDIDCNMVSFYGHHTEVLGKTGSITFQAFAAYACAENNADTHIRGNAAIPGKAVWDDDSVTFGMQASWNCMLSENVFVSPFAGLAYMHAKQDDILEKSESVTRRFDGATLSYWTLSLGAAFRSIHKMGGIAYLSPHVSLAYEGDVARRNPRTIACLDRAGACGMGHTPGRSALRAKAGLDWKIDETWSAGAAYEIGARSSEVNQTVNIQVMAEF